LKAPAYLLKDEEGKDHAVFTGDTLFVGDVGRPDLAQKGAEITMNDLAGMMYDSLQQKIIPLADKVIVYPAHGPGSSCGKNLGPQTQSTIGDEKKTNYALQQPSKEAFVNAVTDGLATPPQYFPVNAKINKEGYSSLDTVMEDALMPLSAKDFKAIADKDEAVILDTRPADIFVNGFVPGSISIGLEGRFAEWAGSLLPFDKELLLVTEPGKEKETIIRLARVGFAKFAGYLNGSFDAWKKSGYDSDLIIDVAPDELAMDLPFDDHLVVIDVRKEPEFAEGHIKDAVNLPLNNMVDPGAWQT
jgi:rhodanese-related sulfurtransferase